MKNENIMNNMNEVEESKVETETVETPVEEATETVACLASAEESAPPKKRGGHPRKNPEVETEPPKKRGGRKPKAAASETVAEEAPVTEEAPPADTVQEKPVKKPRKTKKQAEESLQKAIENTMPDAKAYVEAQESGQESQSSVKTSAPKKKTAKVDTGKWSSDRIGDRENMPIIKDRMKIEIMMTSKALGMTPSDPDSLKYVAKEADEMNPLGDEETQNERTTTIWPKARFIESQQNRWQLVNEPNCPVVDREESIQLPFIYDYQLRGMFKDACGLLSRAKNNESSDLKAYKKWIDGNIFVSPRKIAFSLPETFMDDNGMESPTFIDGKLQTLARPLRTSGPSGERSAIAISEVVPPMTTFKFEIVFTDPKLRAVIIEWLDYGMFRGIGQWRNSGIGTFVWRELNDDWTPKSDENEVGEE